MRGGGGSPSDRSSPRRWRRFLAPSANVAERHVRGTRQVQLDYACDRLPASKLAHAYEMLVPARARVLEAHVKERAYADGGDLRPGVLGTTARGARDCEPDRGTDRVGEDNHRARGRRLRGEIEVRLWHNRTKGTYRMSMIVGSPRCLEKSK